MEFGLCVSVCAAGGQPTVLVVGRISNFGIHERYPVQTICPYCQQHIITTVIYDVGLFSALGAVLLCCMGSVFHDVYTLIHDLLFLPMSTIESRVS